jgi:hypothetical protein
MTEKKTIHLTDDNFSDYLKDDYAAKLVNGVTVGDDGNDRDGPLLTRLLAWIARASGRSKDVRYEMTRPAAAYLLEQLAGWPDSLLEGAAAAGGAKKRKKG